MTPLMSDHARERCKEMGLSTKVAKRIVQNADLIYPSKGHGDGQILMCSDYPDYAVAYFPARNTVGTVLFRTDVTYNRDGIAFTERIAP